MKPLQSEHRHFYVDETGDPNFYGKGKKLIVGDDGCSKTLGLGFLRTTNPEPIRGALNELRNNLAQDRYLKSIPSMRKTLSSFHAKDDCPEVRKAVFECLYGMEFSVQVVVARKRLQTFERLHHGSRDAFYNDLTSHLFERQLHLASENTILFARRGDKAKQHALRSAVETGSHHSVRNILPPTRPQSLSKPLTPLTNRCYRPLITLYGRSKGLSSGTKCDISIS